MGEGFGDAYLKVVAELKLLPDSTVFKQNMKKIIAPDTRSIAEQASPANSSAPNNPSSIKTTWMWEVPAMN